MAGLLLGIAGCTTPSQDSGSAPSCPVDPYLFYGVRAELTDVPTVIRVSWTTAEPTSSQVVFRTEEATRWTDPDPTLRTDHEVLVLGLPPYTETTLRAAGAREGVDTGTDDTGTVGDDPLCSHALTLTTGSWPAELPEVHLAHREEGRATAPAIAVPLIGVDERYFVIIDDQGRVVWALEPEQGGVMYRSPVSRDGDHLWWGYEATSAGNPGIIRKVAWDATVVEEYTVPTMHHDLVELPDGTIATLGLETRTYREGDEERQLLGDTILEVYPDGTVEEIWNAFDWFSPDLGEQYPDFYEGWSTAECWTYANSLSYQEQEDRYLMTLDGLDGLVGVDRSTGELAWIYAEDGPGLAPDDDGDYLERAHRVRADDDGSLLVLERGPYLDGVCAEALRLELDQERGVVHETWSWSTADCVQVWMLGDIWPVEDDHVIAVWSSAGRIDEIDPKGESVYRLDLDMGDTFGFIDPRYDLLP